jgi:hypothetical protein
VQAQNARPYAGGSTGYDISFPQCGAALPPPSTIAVVGFNDGSTFTVNPCFRTEAAWAGLNLSVYLNVNAPDPGHPGEWDQGPAGACAPGDASCVWFNEGYNAVADSISFVRFAGYSPRMWWLDVETTNNWSTDTALNDRVIAGALAAIRAAGGTAGIYSTSLQWGEIAGSMTPGVPAWQATGVPLSTPQTWCAATSFVGGPIYLVQGGSGSFDGNYACN